MTPSIQAIDFVHPNGATVRLLEFGDFIEGFIPLPVEQRSSGSVPMGAAWGNATAEGGGRSVISWSRVVGHASHRIAMSHCMSHPAMMPLGITGKLLFHMREPGATTDANDEIWQLEEAVVSASSPVPFVGLFPYATICTYRAEAGRRIPVKGDFGSCGPIGWDLSPIGEDLRPIGGGACDPPSYTPPALTPGIPPAVVPGWTPPDAVVLRITGEDLEFPFYPWLPELISMDFLPDGEDISGSPKWRTEDIGGRYLIIATDLGPMHWQISVRYTGAGSPFTLTTSSTSAVSPWLAEFSPFDSFGTGSGTPAVEIA